MKDLIIAVTASCGVAAAAAAGAAPVESPIEAPGPAGALKGTLLTPDTARGPVILIIPGSGPTDRDGNRSPRKLARAIIAGAVILVDGDTVVGRHVVVS